MEGEGGGWGREGIGEEIRAGKDKVIPLSLHFFSLSLALLSLPSLLFSYFFATFLAFYTLNYTIHFFCTKIDLN